MNARKTEIKSPHGQCSVYRAMVLAGLMFILPCAAPGQETERRAMLGAYNFGK